MSIHWINLITANNKHNASHVWTEQDNDGSDSNRERVIHIDQNTPPNDNMYQQPRHISPQSKSTPSVPRSSSPTPTLLQERNSPQLLVPPALREQNSNISPVIYSRSPSPINIIPPQRVALAAEKNALENDTKIAQLQVFLEYIYNRLNRDEYHTLLCIMFTYPSISTIRSKIQNICDREIIHLYRHWFNTIVPCLFFENDPSMNRSKIQRRITDSPLLSPMEIDGPLQIKLLLIDNVAELYALSFTLDTIHHYLHHNSITDDVESTALNVWGMENFLPAFYNFSIEQLYFIPFSGEIHLNNVLHRIEKQYDSPDMKRRVQFISMLVGPSIESMREFYTRTIEIFDHTSLELLKCEVDVFMSLVSGVCGDHSVFRKRIGSLRDNLNIQYRVFVENVRSSVRDDQEKKKQQQQQQQQQWQKNTPPKLKHNYRFPSYPSFFPSSDRGGERNVVTIGSNRHVSHVIPTIADKNRDSMYIHSSDCLRLRQHIVDTLERAKHTDVVRFLNQIEGMRFLSQYHPNDITREEQGGIKRTFKTLWRKSKPTTSNTPPSPPCMRGSIHPSGGVGGAVGGGGEENKQKVTDIHNDNTLHNQLVRLFAAKKTSHLSNRVRFFLTNNNLQLL